MLGTVNQKIKSLDREGTKSAVLFLIKTAGVYVAWKAFTYMMEHVPALIPFWNAFRDWCGEILAKICRFIVCDVMGYTGWAVGRNFIIEGTNGIAIKNSCIGISAMVIFAGLVAVYPGKWKHKLWYIPLGMILVQASNVFRLVGLALMQKHSDEAFVRFNHGYTYVIITYSFIFLLVYWWMNKWADKN